LPVYGLDIETDVRDGGLDPATSRVLTVALSQPGCDEVFVGFEHELLTELDDRLAELEPGVLATWNGAAFDLPFLADRARLWGIQLGLQLRLDRGIRLQHAPLPGHAGAYRAAWHQHCHVDAYHLYRDDAPDLSTEAQHAYASSDARLARVLTERRWASASRFVDRLPARHDVA
jgi:DNA polymerase elongation subunit (family B)